MVNSAKFERNSKKELIGRLSRDVSETETGAEAESLGEEPGQPVHLSQASVRSAASAALSAVKDGKRILADNSDSSQKENKDGAQSKIFLRVLAGIVLVGIFIGVGIGVRNIVNSSSEEEELSYIGVLPPSGEEKELLRVSVPSRVCTRTTDVTTDIAASSYYAVFADSFSVAYAKMPNEPAPFASIVKLLSALVVVEEYDLDEMAGLTEEVDDEGNGIGLDVGEKASVKDLLGAALVGSKNDAMYALAQSYPGGVDAFVGRMDEKRADIGLDDTSVVNPIGLDDPGQYSTPHDIAVLMIRAMRDPVIAELVSLPSYTVETETGRQEIVYATNTLLSEVSGVIGGKTGYTADAGLSLVTYVDDDPDFVTVVFNAEDRSEASKVLIGAVREGYDCR